MSKNTYSSTNYTNKSQNSNKGIWKKIGWGVAAGLNVLGAVLIVLDKKGKK